MGGRVETGPGAGTPHDRGGGAAAPGRRVGSGSLGRGGVVGLPLAPRGVTQQAIDAVLGVRVVCAPTGRVPSAADALTEKLPTW